MKVTLIVVLVLVFVCQPPSISESKPNVTVKAPVVHSEFEIDFRQVDSLYRVKLIADSLKVIGEERIAQLRRQQAALINN